MKVFVSITRFTSSRSARDLRNLVKRIEDSGADGVNMFDHVFHSFHAPRQYAEWRLSDPLTVLAAVAGISDRLELMTGILNSDWFNPGLLFRQYSQLAVLASGDRVTAGIGAGWSTEEFKALGIDMDPLSKRLDRLEETLQVATQLYNNGFANFEGEYRKAVNLPLAPVPPLGTKPKLAIGGGSDRIMQMAGRYCDIVDIHGTPKRGAMRGKGTEEKHYNDVRRRAMTTIDDVAERLGVARQAASEVGRPERDITASAFVLRWVDGSKKNIDRAQEDLCEHWGHIPSQSLLDNPYLLFGSPAHIADTLKEREERGGMSRIIIHDELGINETLDFVERLMPHMK
ncbi:hypothetical protein GCM10009819_31690 [Agromyces tropicus]|uniref:Luciferase-like domain-containing protein n=1 Tax=Agromyces tropicus TaxID=555371 RepID=A0ABP5GCV3_9MICO